MLFHLVVTLACLRARSLAEKRRRDLLRRGNVRFLPAPPLLGKPEIPRTWGIRLLASLDENRKPKRKSKAPRPNPAEIADALRAWLRQPIPCDCGAEPGEHHASWCEGSQKPKPALFPPMWENALTDRDLLHEIDCVEARRASLHAELSWAREVSSGDLRFRELKGILGDGEPEPVGDPPVYDLPCSD
jgi:hypothetical protein